MISVYKIVEKENSNVVYVGESNNLYKRWSWHTNKYGQFNKEDYELISVKEFDERKDARDYETLLKKKYGFELTEITRSKVKSKGKSIGGKKVCNKTYTCPKCGITSNGLGYFRWHGDKCKK